MTPQGEIPQVDAIPGVALILCSVHFFSVECASISPNASITSSADHLRACPNSATVRIEPSDHREPDLREANGFVLLIGLILY